MNIRTTDNFTETQWAHYRERHKGLQERLADELEACLRDAGILMIEKEGKLEAVTDTEEETSKFIWIHGQVFLKPYQEERERIWKEIEEMAPEKDENKGQEKAKKKDKN